MPKYELTPWQDEAKTVINTVEADLETVEADLETVISCELPEGFREQLAFAEAGSGLEEDEEYTAISPAPPRIDSDSAAPYTVDVALPLCSYSRRDARPTVTIRAQGSGLHERDESVVDSARQPAGRVVELVSIKHELEQRRRAAAPLPRSCPPAVRQLDIDTRKPGTGTAAPTDLAAGRRRKSFGEELRALRSMLGTAKQEDKASKASEGSRNAQAAGEIAARVTVISEPLLGQEPAGEDRTMILSGSDLDEWSANGEASKEMTPPASRGPSVTQMFALPPSVGSSPKAPRRMDAASTRVARTIGAALALVVIAVIGFALVKPALAAKLYQDLVHPAPAPPTIVSVETPSPAEEPPTPANPGKARSYAAHASAAMAKGDRRRALKIYRAAHELDPKDPVYEVIVRILRREELSRK